MALVNFPAAGVTVSDHVGGRPATHQAKQMVFHLVDRVSTEPEHRARFDCRSGRVRGGAPVDPTTTGSGCRRNRASRPAALTSKHWMDKVWSWDHCFTAPAPAGGDPGLAWNQFHIPLRMMTRQADDLRGPAHRAGGVGLVVDPCTPPERSEGPGAVPAPGPKGLRDFTHHLPTPTSACRIHTNPDNRFRV